MLITIIFATLSSSDDTETGNDTAAANDEDESDYDDDVNEYEPETEEEEERPPQVHSDITRKCLLHMLIKYLGGCRLLTNLTCTLVSWATSKVSLYDSSQDREVSSKKTWLSSKILTRFKVSLPWDEPVRL